MKRLYAIAGILLMLSLIFSGTISAEEVVSLKGKVKSIDLKTGAVIITTQAGQEVTVIVEDEATLSKFKDGRITEGDEVKVKYTIKDGKNISTYFKKAAGC
ncbi:MAG: hypothetical protein N2257_02875 [Thermodesulfovibrionales bacterium]|nr:hypothetical protein [Thermodesulfovibrionales bacterium]